MSQWIRLPLVLLSEGYNGTRLSALECIILAYVIDAEGRQVTAEEMAQATGTSRRSVCRALDVLRQCGAIAEQTSTGRGLVLVPAADILPPKRRGGQGQERERERKRLETSYDLRDVEALMNRF